MKRYQPSTTMVCDETHDGCMIAITHEVLHVLILPVYCDITGKRCIYKDALRLTAG